LKLKCAVCQKPLGKLPISTLKKMFDDFPKDLAKEWKLEMEARKNLAATNLKHPQICYEYARGYPLTYNTNFLLFHGP